MQRRTLLKSVAGIGGASALGFGGIAAFSGTGAATEVTIESENATLTNDTGDLSNVLISPELSIAWSGFDEVVQKARIFIEAKAGSMTEYKPVFRETPWLDNDTYYPEKTTDKGTSGSLENAPVYSRFSELTNEPESYFTSSDADFPAIVLFSDEYDVPDYLGDYGEDYLTGVSIDGGGNYLNGSYGVAGGTDEFDEATGGETNETTVDLRYTISLHVDEQYSPLAMGDSEEYASIKDEVAPDTETYALTYEQTRQFAEKGHPAVTVEETSFTVSVKNEAAGTDDVSGNSGTSVN